MNLFRLTRSYRTLMIAALLLGSLTVAMNLGLQSTSSYLIAKAAQHPSTILLLWVPIVAVRFFATARAGFRYLDRYVGHDVTLRWLRDLKTALYQAIEPLNGVQFRAHHTGDLLSRLGSDVDSLENAVVGFMEPIVVALVGLMLVVAIGLLINPALALALALMLIVTGLVISGGSWHLSHLMSRQQVTLRSSLVSRVVEIIHGRADILAMNLAESVRQDIDGVQRDIDRAKRVLSRVSGLFNGLTLFVTWFGMWLILAAGIRAVQHHDLRPILLPVLVLTTLASFEIVGGLGSAFRDAAGLDEARKRVQDLLSSAPVDQGDGARKTPASTIPTVSFEDVTLALGSPSREILHHLTWELSPGRHVALIGPNGAGKSTVVQLLAGLTWPTEGLVRVDRTPTTAWDLEALRSHITVVPQFPHIFHATLRQNLLLANPSASDARLFDALHEVGLDALLDTLSQGLDTMLGERGTSLSGGEIKRLALARALLKDAPLLVLDEPTEGLDPVSARAVLTMLFTHRPKRTVLWITHSLANLDLVDELAVLDSGRILDQGPVARLVAHPVVRQLMRYQTIPG
ncbi:MAG: thiol reductant ABC exporter subunit CydC [Firmicutes bacterium]|nr:thiol reductant ABC exporter subunit CydC [Bacillota bacterium]